jgi:hypothetical protein
LRFHGNLAPLTAPKAFEQCLDASVKKDWVVYAKRPFSSPRCVLKYLARYTHRVAISQRRLLDLKDGQVSFEYKDYADEHQVKVMTLDSSEFIRRFLMHTLPNGFVRIRYYGFLANRHRQEQLDQCRRLLNVKAQLSQLAEVTEPPELAPDALPAQNRCPVCKRGHLITIELMHPTNRVQPPRPHFPIQQVTHVLPAVHYSGSPP